jgi:hypothetical protein
LISGEKMSGGMGVSFDVLTVRSAPSARVFRAPR